MSGAWIFAGIAGLLVVTGVGLVVAESHFAGSRRISLRLRFPRSLSPEQVVAFLSSLPAARRGQLVLPPPLVFEALATAEGVTHTLTLAGSERDTVVAQLQAACPGIRLEPVDGTSPRVSRASMLRGRSRIYPLATSRAEATATAVLASLQPLAEGEVIRLQWLVAGSVVPPVPHRRQTRGDWLDADGVAESDQLRGLRAKRAELLVNACCRIGVSAGSAPRSSQLIRRVQAGLSAMDAPGMRLQRSWLPSWWVRGRLAVQGLPLLGWPLLLNSLEASGLLGLPLGEADLPGVERGAARQLPAPSGVLSSGALVGVSDHPGTEGRELRLDDEARLRHVALIGPTGVGKSTLMAGMVLDDLAAGRAVVVIDPKRDLVEAILDRVPVERTGDVVVLDPTDTARPVGLNVLRAEPDSEAERELVSEHLLGVFQSLWKDSWGPRSDDILRASLLTLASARAGDGSAFTLVELPELLTNSEFRRAVLAQDGVPEHVRGFWKWFSSASPVERSQAMAPVLNKVRAFTMRTPMRLMLGQSKGFDLRTILDEPKVVLVPLSAGELGRPAAELLGSLIVARLWQVIRSRTQVAPAERRPIFIYLDEFQDVLRLPVDLGDLLAQARGLGAGLTLAHQHLSQLPNDVRSAVRSTARTEISFQLAADDARVVARGFEPSLEASDLVGLDAFHFAMRPYAGGQVIRPVTGRILPLPPGTGQAGSLRQASRERFGVERSSVEAQSLGRLGGSVARPPVGRRRKAES